MKNQNKNQKAPETKLTDAQLGEVNAGITEVRMKMQAEIELPGKMQANGKAMEPANGTVLYAGFKTVR